MIEKSSTIGMGQGVFVTLVVDANDKPLRISVTAGKTGSANAAVANTINCLSDVAFAAGATIADVCKALRGIMSNMVWFHEGQKLLSISDAVSQGLDLLILKNMEDFIKQHPVEPPAPASPLEQCPECHSFRMLHSGGRGECVDCGYLKEDTPK